MDNHPKLRSQMRERAAYRIRVLGRLGRSWSDRLQGMTVSIIEEEDQTIISEISGTLPDEAALMGVLGQLYDFRIPILSLTRVDPRSPSQPHSTPPRDSPDRKENP